MPEIERAVRQIDRLIPLVGSPVQVTTTQEEPNKHENWDLVAPAMLLSATSCLVSIRWLAESRLPLRDQDASVLLRRLYEHAVNFAWIAVDPAANTPRWVADDYRYRLRADDDLRLLGVPGLQPEERVEYDKFIERHRKMPNVAKRAAEADQYWSTRLAGHGIFPGIAGQTQSGMWSLRGMYAAVYRAASANVHPSPQSLEAFVWPGSTSNTFCIDADGPVYPESYTMAAAVFAVMLLLSAMELGRPNRADILAAFME